jgi:hypothetical protein
MRTAPVGSLETLLETLDHRRPAVAAHSRRVAVFARHLGDIAGLQGDEMATLLQAALVHEAGALVGRLGSATELPGFQSWCGLSDDVDDVLWYSVRPYNRHTHAPLGARILAVAHAFDELITPREYNVPLSATSARMAIGREAGRKYCPMAVNALLMARLELLTSPSADADLRIHSDGPVALDGDRLEGSPFRADYRFVTTS